MSLAANFKGHLTTVLRHRHKVFIHCVKAGIPVQGLLHDLSKFAPDEFIPGVLYFQGTRSPNEAEREDNGYSRAWIHHKGRNKHHFEYWNDMNPATKVYEPVKMPTKYLIEMFCDRVAASKTYQGKNYTDAHPLQYYNHGTLHRRMHPETDHDLRLLLTMLAERGEDYTFRYIRKKLLPRARKGSLLELVEKNVCRK